MSKDIQTPEAAEPVHGEEVMVTDVVARRLAALAAVVRRHGRHSQAGRLAELLESAASTAAVAPVEDGRRLPALTLDTLQEAADLLKDTPELGAEIGGALDRSVAPALGGKEPVAISSILYRVRFIWPDAQWVLREPPGVKASFACAAVRASRRSARNSAGRTSSGSAARSGSLTWGFLEVSLPKRIVKTG